MPERRFLWVVAMLAMLVVGAAIAWRFAGQRMLEGAFEPTVAFADVVPPPAPDYRLAAAWTSWPGRRDDPARWTPDGYSAAPHPAAALFFISPTAFLDRKRWNAPIDDSGTNARLDQYARMQASVFNGVASIWIPRYRQATFGAFLVAGPDSARALDLAYSDVERAFRRFLELHPSDGPIILAGHSQGSRHLLHLLLRRHADIAGRIVAIYAGGWPVALPGDIERLAFPACTRREQAGCIASWQSYAVDGDLERAYAGYASVADLSGRRPGPALRMLCTNPLTGGAGAAGPDANSGALVADRIEPYLHGARCDAKGLLLVDPSPGDMGPLVLPGGNYHFYDYALFWANLRADVEARLAAFAAAHPKGGG